MAEKGKALKGALASNPSRRGDMDEGKITERTRRAASRAASNAPRERLSPGVYRSASGGLVTQGGRPIQRQQSPGMAAQAAGEAAARGMGGVAGQVGQMAGDAFQNLPGQLNSVANQTQQLAQQSAGQAGFVGNQFGQPYRPLAGHPGYAGAMFGQLPQMPQASANQGGRYRLSPGVYGTQQQAMQQYNQQMANMGIQPAYTNYEDLGTMLNYFGPGGGQGQRRG
jgi:hypothetical protein